jgi:hypothetical protein
MKMLCKGLLSCAVYGIILGKVHMFNTEVFLIMFTLLLTDFQGVEPRDTESELILIIIFSWIKN